ncbi:hypothetical protein [Methylobacterium durans]|uniref:Uncharacterized protein n=1 Tax=Methylobacterium durans TaxID=2202825 RepID=A0A2U8WBL8_9HYPH|nr:hypothetical protein [Methylobacterium durans]AWN42850.1 hypothetical protein DK389_23040 [Methylobacterium durans]
MRKIALVSATALCAAALAAPQAEARPLGVGAAVGAGVAGLAVGSAIGAAASGGYYGGYGYDYGYPPYGAYSWGGPEIAGYTYVPAGYAYPPVYDYEDSTTVVSRPSVVSRSRTIVDTGYAPAAYGYDDGYETRRVSRSVASRSYGTSYDRGYGYRSVSRRSYEPDYGYGRNSYRSVSVRSSEGRYGISSRDRLSDQGGYHSANNFETRRSLNERSSRQGLRNVAAGASETAGRITMERGSRMTRGTEIDRGSWQEPSQRGGRNY